MDMWPQFRSPLLWDVFAVSTYATVSLLFWYVGMIPDLATLRDRADRARSSRSSTACSPGLDRSSRHWHRFERAYLLLAALATPLVLSVHSVVSFDFATSQIPGWHTTIFPPYFVAGADVRRVRDGAERWRSRPGSSSASRTSSPAGTSTTCAR